MSVKVTSISLPPELHKDFNKIIHLKQLKFNTVIKQLVEDYVIQNLDLVQRFDQTFPELNK